jgi:hypothetical protein
MATKLFMKQFQSSANLTNQFASNPTYSYASVTAQVLTFITSITNTVASGTKIQCTKTAGGAILQFISPPLAAAVTISGTITNNCWALESNNLANAGMRCIHSRWSDGTVISDTSKGVELTTSAAVQNWTDAAPTSTIIGVNDRIVITWYVTNVGTMGGSQTVTLDYGGKTAAADGDTWVQFTENITFQTEAELVQFANQVFTSVSGNTVAASLPGISAAGNLLVVSGGLSVQSETMTIADDKVDTFTGFPGNPTNWGSVQREYFWYAQNIIGGSATTVTLTKSASNTNGRGVSVAEYGGMATSAFDASPSAPNTGTGTAITSNLTAVTAVPCELIVCIEDDLGVSVSAGTNFVKRQTNAEGQCMFDRSVQVGAAYQGLATLTTSVAWIMHVATFKWAVQPAAGHIQMENSLTGGIAQESTGDISLEY